MWSSRLRDDGLSRPDLWRPVARITDNRAVGRHSGLFEPGRSRGELPWMLVLAKARLTDRPTGRAATGRRSAISRQRQQPECAAIPDAPHSGSLSLFGSGSSAEQNSPTP